MSNKHELVAIKRRWVPEWLFSQFSYPFDLIRYKWLPFRWILTSSNKDYIELRIKQLSNPNDKEKK